MSPMLLLQKTTSAAVWAKPTWININWPKWALRESTWAHTGRRPWPGSCFHEKFVFLDRLWSDPEHLDSNSAGLPKSGLPLDRSRHVSVGFVSDLLDITDSYRSALTKNRLNSASFDLEMPKNRLKHPLSTISHQLRFVLETYKIRVPCGSS